MSYAIDQIVEQFERGRHEAIYIGLVEGRMTRGVLGHLPEEADLAIRRPIEQWWLALRPAMMSMADRRPDGHAPKELPIIDA